MRKIVIISLKLLKNILIFILIGAILTASVKNVQKTVLVEKFKSNGVFQEEMSSNTIKYYKIESDEEIPAYKQMGYNALPGGPGDIVVSTQATLINPLVSGLVSFFAGGHAGICTEDYSDFEILLDDTTAIEATGLEEGENTAEVFNRTYWMNKSPFTEVIGLRVNMTEEQRKEVLSASAALIGDPYNYSFIFDTTNKSYCSDLVSKAYSHIGVNLNKDDFTTSIYDLIVSSDTYISYYHYFDSDGIKHIYYLG